MNEDKLFGRGWAFFTGGGSRNGSSLPALDDPLDLLEWMRGFGAAMACRSADPGIRTCRLRADQR